MRRRRAEERTYLGADCVIFGPEVIEQRRAARERARIEAAARQSYNTKETNAS